jgi:diguanylate cyclase (GGDEF)-like protein/PAS domain S-box-containing protein
VGDQLNTSEGSCASLLNAETVDGVFMRVDPLFESAFGWQPAELLGKHLLDFIHPHDVASTGRELDRLASDGGSVGFQNRFRAADGSYRRLIWLAQRNPRTEHVTTAARVIPGETTASEPFRAALESSPVPQILVGPDGLIEHANAAAEQLFGYRREELLGQSIELLVPEELRRHHSELRGKYAEHPGRRSMGTGRDLIAVRRDGSQIPVEVGLNPVEIDGERRVMAAIVDLSLRKEHERVIHELNQELESSNRRLSHLASTDELTALKNRRFFLDWLGVQIRLAHRRSSPLSLVLIDIDHFKEYNDDFGHPSGDGVLRALSGLLTSVARRSDVVGRFGGEEFVVGLPETGREGAAALGERIREAVVSHDWTHRPITVSAGVATVHLSSGSQLDAEATRTELIAEADRALYTSKNAGRDRVTHVDDVLEQSG